MIARFPSCYLPSVEYLTELSQQETIYIDTAEPFRKQTLRNRCFILSPNGIQCLTVPVHYHFPDHPATADIKISYAENWQERHCRSIMAAYGRAPWFEFIYADLESILKTEYEYLHELNGAVLQFLIKKFKITTTLTSNAADAFVDYLFLGNRRNTSASNKMFFQPYNQVFGDRFDFLPNLSSLDLVMNTGSLTVQSLPVCRKLS